MDSEYANKNAVAGQLQTGKSEALARAVSVTVRENIDHQILQAKKRVEELQATKARMETSGLLDLRIEDIRQAMNY